MNGIRKLMCWLFAISSVLCLWNAVRLIQHTMHRNDAFQSSRSFFIASFLPVLAIIYSLAWWTVLKDKRSAKSWGIVASLTFVFLPILGRLASSRSFPSSLWIMLGIGVLGLVAFSVRRVVDHQSEQT